MVTLLNPARLSAARMASNSVGGSTTSTVHITVSRRLLPRRKNRFPSSGNPASAKARVTACVSAVSTAIRYRIDRLVERCIDEFRGPIVSAAEGVPTPRGPLLQPPAVLLRRSGEVRADQSLSRQQDASDPS